MNTGIRSEKRREKKCLSIRLHSNCLYFADTMTIVKTAGSPNDHKHFFISATIFTSLDEGTFDKVLKVLTFLIFVLSSILDVCLQRCFNLKLSLKGLLKGTNLLFLFFLFYNGVSFILVKLLDKFPFEKGAAEWDKEGREAFWISSALLLVANAFPPPPPPSFTFHRVMCTFSIRLWNKMETVVQKKEKI